MVVRSVHVECNEGRLYNSSYANLDEQFHYNMSIIVLFFLFFCDLANTIVI